MNIPFDRGFEAGQKVTNFAGQARRMFIIRIRKIPQIMSYFKVTFSFSQRTDCNFQMPKVIARTTQAISFSNIRFH